MPDEKHIGGLSLALPLLLFYQDRWDTALHLAEAHLALTHPGPLMRTALACFADILHDILLGADGRQALQTIRATPLQRLSGYPFAELSGRADADVARNVFSTACYLEQSLPLTLSLAWKYQDDPEQALVVNTNLGGDNCHRGVVLGALLGALHGAGLAAALVGRAGRPSHRFCAVPGNTLQGRWLLNKTPGAAESVAGTKCRAPKPPKLPKPHRLAIVVFR